ncbi:MAG: lysostaphin resistance A-like protein [Acidobacteriota bacterium]
MAQASRRSAGARFARFALLALLFSWSYWLAVLAGLRGWLPFQIPLGPVGAFGPAMAAVVAAALDGGRPAVAALLRSLLRWRARPSLYVAALLGMTVVLIATVAIQIGRGAPVPDLANLDRWYLLPGLMLISLVLGGPLGEEVGWRGYALPRLLERSSPFVASLVLAALWFAWHLPLFWLPGSSQEGIPIGTFAATLLGYSLVFTWLHLRSGGSTLLAVLLHTGINTAWFLLPTVLPGALEQPGFSSSFLVVSALVAAGVIAASGRAFFRRAGGAAR